MVEEQPFKLVNVTYHDPQTDGCKHSGTKVKMLGEDQGFELALSTSTQPSNEAGKWWYSTSTLALTFIINLGN